MVSSVTNRKIPLAFLPPSFLCPQMVLLAAWVCVVGKGVVLLNKASRSLEGCTVIKTYADKEKFARVSGGNGGRAIFFPEWTQGDKVDQLTFERNSYSR